MSTTLTHIPSDIIQAHILPHLDGPSLSTVATVSTHLHHLCSDDPLWADVIKSTWPSTTHPRVTSLISSSPSGHRSFFQDSFPTLIAAANCHRRRHKPPSTTTEDPPQLISAVDIRYRNNVVYSAVQFTDISSSDFLSSKLQLGFSDNPVCNIGSGSGSLPGSKQEIQITRPIDVEVDEFAGADQATLSDLERSVSLSWIVIDPTRKRSGNLSSIKSVSVRHEWMGIDNETVLKFVTVLPGPDPGEMVQFKIRLVLGVNIGGVGLHVRHVGLNLEDLSYRGLNGREFFIIMQRAISEEYNIIRRVMDDEERLRCVKEFKEMKIMKKECERLKEEKREFAIKINFVFIFVCFCFSIYSLIQLL